MAGMKVRKGKNRELGAKRERERGARESETERSDEENDRREKRRDA